MSTRFLTLTAAGLLLAACGQNTGNPSTLASPAGPTAFAGPGATSTPTASDALVPFHSELSFSKVPGSDISLCTHALPPGKIYLARNTNTGTAISTHLGTGTYENHTCVYGAAGKAEGWFADIRWTAANGDVLLATSDFLYWTGTPGKSVAVDSVAFQNGGTGRFEYAKGEGMCYVDAPARTAVYDGTLRYGKNEK